MKWLLAQYNVAQLAHDEDAPEIEGFHALLNPIHAAGDLAKGFVWRFKGEGADDAMLVRPPDGNPRVLVALTVWETVEDLANFMRGPHLEAYLRRREWFVKGSGQNVCWWVRSTQLPVGNLGNGRTVLVPMPEPTITEGERRLDELRRLGPGPYAFTLRHPYEAPQ